MFDASEYPVETVQELAKIMTFVNEVMRKMRDDETLSSGAMEGLRCLLISVEENLSSAGGELSRWRRVSSGGPTKLASTETPRKTAESKSEE